MANVKINNLLLNGLAKHFRNGGEDSEEAIAAALGVTKDIPATVAAYRAALVEKFPTEFGAEPEDDGLGEDDDQPVEQGPPPPIAESQAKAAALFRASRRFILRNPDGTDTVLEVVRETSKAVILAPTRVRQPVTVMLKGKPVEVDLAELKTLPGNSERHGVPVARLIEIAELALA